MRIAFAADHAGFHLKNELAARLAGKGFDVIDLGTNSAAPVDYPDCAEAVAAALGRHEADRGIIICGSGAGVSIAANKFPGIRAAVCHDTYTGHQAVEHDDMNVLCIGGRVIGPAVAHEIVDAFLSASFSGEERHRRRLNKVLAIESRYCGGPPVTPGDELDQLVSELQSVPLVQRGTSGRLEDWLRQVRELNGSDLLLVAGRAPMGRVAGSLQALSGDTLSGEDIEAAAQPYVGRHLQHRYAAGEAVDLAFRVTGLGRFRMNLHRERGRAAAAIRALPLSIPRVRDLRFPHDISQLARLPRGLVLIGGPTGSGKTTTLAALIGELNARESRHIITIEDPIKYDHPHGCCLIEQVEIGIDAADFPTALRAAVRQAPDVIVVGEMRDPETMRIALQAAETGHLVFATVHTTDVAAAIARIADAFPTERQNAVRQELSMALAAVLTQSLLPVRAGGLMPVGELMMVSYGARQHIRKNALQHLNQEITITRKLGSFTFEESLARMVQSGAIERADALLRAAHPEELELLLNGPRPAT